MGGGGIGQGPAGKKSVQKFCAEFRPSFFKDGMCQRFPLGHSGSCIRCIGLSLGHALQVHTVWDSASSSYSSSIPDSTVRSPLLVLAVQCLFAVSAAGPF